MFRGMRLTICVFLLSAMTPFFIASEMDMLGGIQDRHPSHGVVTIVDNENLVCGAVLLARQLQLSSRSSQKYTTIALVPSNTLSSASTKELVEVGWHVVVKEAVEFPWTIHNPLNRHAFFLTQLWTLTLYDKILYLNAKVLPTATFSASQLLSCPATSAITKHDSPGVFDTSVMVIEPDMEIYIGMLRNLTNMGATVRDMGEYLRNLPPSVLQAHGIDDDADLNSPVYESFVPEYFFNKIFPDWHDLENTGRHHNNGIMVLSSTVAVERLKIWEEHMTSAMEVDFFGYQLSTSTSAIYFRGFPPWSCSASCAELGYECGFNKNGVYDDATVAELYAGSSPSLNSFWWLQALTGLTPEQYTQCVNKAAEYSCADDADDKYYKENTIGSVLM